MQARNALADVLCACAEAAEPAVSAKETLESIDLVVEADAEQLDAFYDSDSASETEPTPRFSTPMALEPASPRLDAKPAVDTADDVDPSAIPDGVAEEEEKEEEMEEEVEEENATTPDVEATEPSAVAEEQQAALSPDEATSSDKQDGEDLEAGEKSV
jgi:hypothetical protein